MSEIPDSSNFFSGLHTSLSRQQIAELYRRLGWEVRKCSWVDYEICCPFAELVIEAEGPVLMHGPVAEVMGNAEQILAPLREAGVAYTAECYGGDMQLLQEFRWAGPA